MKTAEFSILGGRVIISMPSDDDIEKLLEGLRELGVEIDEELRSMCG